MQNRKAIESKDIRRLCPECQMTEWIDHLNVFEAYDVSRQMMIQAKEVDRRIY